MAFIRIEYPNQTPTGLFRAVAFDSPACFEVLEISEARTATDAIDLIAPMLDTIELDDDAREQVMVEGMLQ
jgi:hypothetical protein